MKKSDKPKVKKFEAKNSFSPVENAMKQGKAKKAKSTKKK